MMDARNSRGYTLVELMVVIVILTILLGVGVSGMVNFNNAQRLIGARAGLMTDLRYAQSLARSQQLTYEVRLSSASYSIVCPSTATTVLVRPLPAGVTIAAADTVVFYPWGLATADVITVSQGSTTRIVRTSPTGQVTHD